jgi:hypothetical protein
MDARRTLLALGAAVVFASCAESPNGPSRVSPEATAPLFLNTASVAWSCLAASHAGIFSSEVACSQRTLLRIETTSADLVPGAPTNLAAAVNGSTVTFTWTAPAGGDAPTSYVIEAGSVAGAVNLANFETGSAATTQVVTDVPNGTYYVRLRAKNGAGPSGVSNEITVVVGGGGGCTQAPPTPSNFAASVGGSTVSLSWAGVTGASSYIIEAGAVSGSSALANFDTGSTATSYTAPNVPAGTYYVRGRARNACGTSGPSNEVTVVIGGPSVTILLTPINNSAIAQNDPTIGCPLHPTRGYGHRIFFDWTDSFSPYGIAGYELFAKKREAAFPIVDTFVGSSQFVLLACNAFVADPNLQNWEWRVRARDAQGVFSDWSTTGLFHFVPCRLPNGTACRT